ncbi:MAG: hypothetical protein ACK5YR_16590 [Pirellula sp.]|jgi:hypothetical protein
MKRSVAASIAGSLILISTMSENTFAIKEFGDAFKTKYVDASTSESFKMLVSEAKCNVCHVDGEDKKKIRNPYGDAIDKKGLEAKEYKALLKSNPVKAKEQIEKIFSDIEEMKAEWSDKTFGERIKDGKLPGGDVKGR